MATEAIQPLAQTTQAPLTIGNAARNVLFQKVTQEQIFASLPAHIDRQQFAALFLDSLAAMVAAAPWCEERVAQQPNLIARAAQRTAAMGATPGRGAKEIALIFRKGWKKNNGDMVPDSVDVLPEWRLYIRKMRGAPNVADVDAVLVHASDTFSFKNGVLVHEFDPFDEGRRFLNPAIVPNADLRGAYTVATYADGRKKYHFTTAAKIEASRKCSANADSGPWLDWYPEMVRKTALRDAAAALFVQWTPLQLDEINVLMADDDKALDNDPARGGYARSATADLEQVARPARPTNGLDKLASAMRLESAPLPEPIDFHVQVQPQAELVETKATVTVTTAETARNPAEYCPVCSKHYPDLAGEMDATRGCPSCMGKAPK